MKHTHEDKNNNNNEKEHIFCTSDEKFKSIYLCKFTQKLIFLVKNRHHTALFIQNNYIKLLIRKGPLSTIGKTMYSTEWMWKVSQINDNQWHSYKFMINYPDKVYRNFIRISCFS